MEADRITRIAQGFWAALSSSASTGDEWRARRPLPEVSPRLLGSISSSGSRRFLVELEESESSVEDSRSRGILVSTVELVEESGPKKRFITLECRDSSSHELFDLVGADIALVIIGYPPDEAIRRVLGKWRRFWGQMPRSLLTKEEQIGLFAELWFLAHWMAPAAGPAKAIARWRGPFRARHDFEWPGRSVEVKSTSTVVGRNFRVNGIDQLEPPDAGALSLFALRIREEVGATYTLPSIVLTIRSMVENDGDALGMYETALIQVGYTPAHEPDYSLTHWRVVDERLYPIDDRFPRLRPSHFSSGLPRGVSEISYNLDVGVAGEDFVSMPAAAASILR